MHILIDKRAKRGYYGKTRKGISDASGVSVHKLRRWMGFYEDDGFIWCDGEECKSNQGGLR